MGIPFHLSRAGEEDRPSHGWIRTTDPDNLGKVNGGGHTSWTIKVCNAYCFNVIYSDNAENMSKRPYRHEQNHLFSKLVFQHMELLFPGFIHFSLQKLHRKICFENFLIDGHVSKMTFTKNSRKSAFKL